MLTAAAETAEAKKQDVAARPQVAISLSLSLVCAVEALAAD